MELATLLPRLLLLAWLLPLASFTLIVFAGPRLGRAGHKAGHVATGAFDPIEEICSRAQDKNAWVHVDGAFGM